MVQQRDKHGGHAGEDGDLLALDLLQRSFRFEAHVQHDFRAETDAEQEYDSERIDVERRQRPQHALLARRQDRGKRMRFFMYLGDGRGEIGVREHGALGQAGGPAGILQHRDGFVDVADGIGLRLAIVVDELGEGDVAFVRRHLGQLLGGAQMGPHALGMAGKLGEIADHEMFHAGLAQQMAHLGIERGKIERDENVGLAVLDLVLEHALGVERGIVDDRAARPEHAEESDRVMRRIGEIEPDMHARFHAQRLKALGGAIGERIELRVSDLAAHEIERGRGSAIGAPIASESPARRRFPAARPSARQGDRT